MPIYGDNMKGSNILIDKRKALPKHSSSASFHNQYGGRDEGCVSKNQMIKGGGYVGVGNNVDDNDDSVDDDRVSKKSRAGYLPDVFQVPHGQVDSSQAGVDTTTSGDPDRTVDVQRRTEQLALLLRLGLCKMLDR
jgi:hypothetical protein